MTGVGPPPQTGHLASDPSLEVAGCGPTVSILIAAYNAAPYIAEALDSVTRQRYTDFETILVDDGSTDDLEGAIRPYRDRIRFIRQEQRGLAAAQNAGLRWARGRYVALLDGDDVWLPEYLERLVGLLAADPRLDVVFPNAIVFGQSKFAGQLYQDRYPPGEPITFEKLLIGRSHVFGSAVFKRDLALAVGRFDEALKCCEDYDLWLRMALRGARFASTPEPLHRYRRHARTLSNNKTEMVRGRIRVYEKLSEHPEVAPEVRALIPSRIARAEARLNLEVSKELVVRRDFAGARRHLGRANAHLRRTKLRLVGVALRIAPWLLAAALDRRQRASADPGRPWKRAGRLPTEPRSADLNSDPTRPAPDA